ncbi:aspartate--ammonia ligase [Mycoplasmopsis lipophila]|uniref:aspartate--ammonia ligase n=1 Tax=Mycoplasmopsis lipophila TaxID=2117 RepID=UPI003873A6A7
MYKSKLNIKETQLAIQDLKFAFTKQLNKNLNLVRVSAPLFVDSESKINDGLSGEKPVSFNPKNEPNISFEIVHSLAKWKRIALKKYMFDIYEGIYTDMNAIRREEDLDSIHSYYVDQWDWELVIREEDRNTDFLKAIVTKIYNSIRYVENKLNFNFPVLSKKLPDKIFFITAQDLENMYPNLSIDERELEITKKHKAVFIIGIGNKLNKSNVPHSKRSFDYDDWDLNGDMIFYHPILNKALEISSMGIRVNAKSLSKQKELMNIKNEDLRQYHKDILDNKLPLTIGGGIGQSRLSMFLLEKKHIGEVQVGFWPNNIIEDLKKEGVKLL